MQLDHLFLLLWIVLKYFESSYTSAPILRIVRCDLCEESGDKFWKFLDQCCFYYADFVSLCS